MTPRECPFCSRILLREVQEENTFAVAFPDGFPLSKGHTLVVPKRHLADPFELDDPELMQVAELVARVKRRLSAEHAPDGFNVGLNVGVAAGQTVAHAHVHVIPRYAGDAEDPRGGIRWVLPERAPYWRGEGTK